MAFTLTSAITEVRTLINEDEPGYWTDAQITSWIQQGVLDWTEKSLLLIRRDIVTLVADTTRYTTSTNSYIDEAIRTIHATYNDKAIQRVTFEQLRGHNARTLGGDTTPAFYFDHYDGTSFVFYIGPTPSTDETATEVTVYFACRSDDITEIPYEYQPHIFLFAAHKAKLRERQYQEALIYYQMYVNNISFARQDSLIRGVQPIDSFRIK